MNRILVTGCAGFIGMHVAQEFLRRGFSVVGVDNVNNYYEQSLKEDRLLEISRTAEGCDGEWQFYRRDITDVSFWKEISPFELAGVVHLAAQAGVRYSLENPSAYIESNIIGFQRVLDFCVTNKIKPLLYASSSSVYGKNSEQPFTETEACDAPESYYAATKRMNEFMAQVYFKTRGLSSIGLRFFTVYGPWGRPDMAPMLFTKAAFSDEIVKLFNYGRQSRDFTYIDDIVLGVVELFISNEQLNGSEVVNIGKGSPDSLMQFVQLIERYTLRSLKLRRVEAQPGDVEETFSSLVRIKELAHYEPQTSLEEGLKRLIEWYKGYYKPSKY